MPPVPPTDTDPSGSATDDKGLLGESPKDESGISPISFVFDVGNDDPNTGGASATVTLGDVTVEEGSTATIRIADGQSPQGDDHGCRRMVPDVVQFADADPDIPSRFPQFGGNFIRFGVVPVQEDPMAACRFSCDDDHRNQSVSRTILF